MSEATLLTKFQKWAGPMATSPGVKIDHKSKNRVKDLGNSGLGIRDTLGYEDLGLRIRLQKTQLLFTDFGCALLQI